MKIKPLFVKRDEGSARVSLDFDFEKNTIAFEGESSLHPVALEGLIGIFENNEMDMFQFEGPVRINGSGIVYLYNQEKTDVKLRINGEGMGIHGFVSDDCSLDMRLKGYTNTISNISGSIYDGTFSGMMLLVLPLDDITNTTYRMEWSVDKVDYQDLMEALSNIEDQEYKGVLSGKIKAQGFFGEGGIEAMKGEGSVRVKDGRVFLMPIFGGLSTVMTKIIPGLDFMLRQSDAKADFIIADGRIHSDKIAVDGDVLSLSASGDYYFNKKLDFNIQITLMKEHTVVAKLIRVLTYPISKLFEFRLRGTKDDPHWYPVNFSGDLLEKIGLKNEKENEEKKTD
jgi:hypothetical protein